MFDPSLMIAPDVGGKFVQAFKEGQQTREANIAKGAMAALVRDPNNQKALEALAQVDPGAAAQFQQRRSMMAQQNAEQYRSAILDGVPLYQKMGAPTDDAGWQRFKAAMAQTGHNVSQMPDHFDPQYVQGASQMYQAWSKPEEPKYIPLQAGGSVAKVDPATGQVTMAIAPNDGSQPTGAPAQNLPRVTDQATYDAVPPGSQYLSPDGHVRVKQGGQSQSGSGGFR